MCSEIDADEVRSLLEYNPETGELFWLKSRGGNARAGSTAGSIRSDGYRIIKIHRRPYYAHRLAFLIMTGHWPKETTDHIDRDKGNNRWANLRECSFTENNQNQGPHRDNVSGVPGVQRVGRSNAWRARIKFYGKQYHLGVFTNKEEAGAAYRSAKRRLHPTSTRSGTYSRKELKP